jgi:hypothetical protein
MPVSSELGKPWWRRPGVVTVVVLVVLLLVVIPWVLSQTLTG